METPEVIINNTTPEVDVEALQAQLKEQEDKNKELGDKIYKLKKEKKEVEVPQVGLSKADLEIFYKEQKFFETNPDLVEHRDSITEITSKGISFEDAKILLISRDKTIVNRDITKSSNFSDGEPSISQKTYSQEEASKYKGHTPQGKVFWGKVKIGEIKVV